MTLSGQSGRPFGKTVRGGARSSLIAQASVQLGSATATVILARILMPAEFGIIALAQSLLGMASLVGLTGITAAIVTSSGDVRVKSATYFWAAVSIGAVLACSISLAAPLVVRALGQPAASAYVAVLSLSLPITLGTLIPQALLQRRLQFGRMNATTVIGATAYFVFEVVFALRGWGAWAVIWGQVIGAVTSMLIAITLSRWLPTARPRFREITGDLRLIGNMGAGSFLAYLGKNLDYWSVSGVLGAAPLGIYYVAYVLPSIVRVRLSAVFRQIMLPILSNLSNHEEQTEAWHRTARTTFGLALPAMFGIAAVSDPLISLLFGEQWEMAILAMQFITLAGIADISIHAVSTAAIARRTFVFRSTLLLGLRAALIGIGAITAAWIWRDLSAVAAAVLIASVVTLVVQEFAIARPLGIGWIALGAEQIKILTLCGIMFIGVQASIAALPGLPPLIQLLIAVPTGIFIYVGLGWWTARASVRDSVTQFSCLIFGK